MTRWWGVGVVAALLLAAAPAAGEVEGPCEAMIESTSVDGLDADDVDDAVALSADESASIGFEADQPIRSWNASIHYGPFSAPLSRGQAPANATTAVGVIPVADFAWMGVGVYRVSGEVTLEDGSACRGEALVDVRGSPLDTVLGTASIAVAGLGGLGLLASARSGYQDGGEDARPPGEDPPR